MTIDNTTANSPTIWTTEKLHDRAYQEIKSKIMSRELAPGERLVDSQLAEKYGISRTPVRDAIRKLVEEGLVVSSSKKGFFVFKPRAKDIVEIFELRLILDKAVVTKIITEMLPSNYSHYMRELQRISDLVEEGNAKGRAHFPHYDEAFHGNLIQFSSNTRIINIYTENQAQMKGFRIQTSINQERFENATAMHRELLAVIKSMDLDAAIRSVAAHVEVARKDALADYTQEDED